MEKEICTLHGPCVRHHRQLDHNYTKILVYLYEVQRDSKKNMKNLIIEKIRPCVSTSSPYFDMAIHVWFEYVPIRCHTLTTILYIRNFSWNDTYMPNSYAILFYDYLTFSLVKLLYSLSSLSPSSCFQRLISEEWFLTMVISLKCLKCVWKLWMELIPSRNEQKSLEN